LNETLDKQLISLCEFSRPHVWTLLYRASSQGFSSQNFHSHCDNKANTLTVIKTTNGNIFGGFTQQAWDSSSGYKIDNNAFIFSLVNKENNHVKIKIKPGGQNAICCHSSYGPRFGGGHDIFISSDSNTNQTSYSDLGHSYQLSTHTHGTEQAKSFLAGSNNFQVSEIEVFQQTE
jgi:hypothetical protein